MNEGHIVVSGWKNFTIEPYSVLFELNSLYNLLKSMDSYIVEFEINQWRNMACQM